MPIHRRTFLARASSGVGSAAIATIFQNFLQGATRSDQTGYGPLVPVRDETTGLELLMLPDGFRYQSFGWTGDRFIDGRPTPGRHDGMAVIKTDQSIDTICRNHEIFGDGSPFGEASFTYDPKAGGGCSNLRFDRGTGRFMESRPSLSGTVKNCAGGPTPWGTWLSCEETVLGPGDQLEGRTLSFERPHGFIFEVPASGAATAEPLTDMGRFVHEAVAVDPATSIVYETEDRDSAGFYRFIPRVPHRLAVGGQLQMLKVKGKENLKKGLRVGDKFDTSWVDIEDPTRPHSPGTQDEGGVYCQGKQQGAATFARLEGCCYHARGTVGDHNAREGGNVYLVSTSGGDEELGQVFEYDPRKETITLIFESPSAEVVQGPDNITVSPRGGILLCEDGEYVPQRLHGLTDSGILFPFAANNIILSGERNGIRGDFRGEEWAGATFSSDGQWLFVNIRNRG